MALLIIKRPPCPPAPLSASPPALLLTPARVPHSQPPRSGLLTRGRCGNRCSSAWRGRRGRSWRWRRRRRRRRSTRRTSTPRGSPSTASRSATAPTTSRHPPPPPPTHTPLELNLHHPAPSLAPYPDTPCPSCGTRASLVARLLPTHPRQHRRRTRAQGKGRTAPPCAPRAGAAVRRPRGSEGNWPTRMRPRAARGRAGVSQSDGRRRAD